MTDQASASKDLIARADEAYKPIVDFGAWAHLTVDVQRWRAHLAMVQQLGSSDSAKLARARDVAKRAAAIDTGAIEGLYQLDRGITITIAAQTAMWQAAFEKEKEKVRALIECQLDAYDYVLDLSTKSVPVAEAWIRELHKKICLAQETFKALTPEGFQDQQLNHGEYKRLPNHVLKEGDALHAYAPVQQTPIEMGRLCETIRSGDFESAHPVLQAAYAHHAFTRIHPFQDGNGRVARALASIFLYRAASIPLLVLFDHRNAYIDALEAADAGNYEPFVNFVFSRCIDAFALVAESLRTAGFSNPTETSKAIGSLYLTKGGYTHNQVDLAGQTLLVEVHSELAKQVNAIQQAGQLRLSTERRNGNYPIPAISGYRHPVSIALEAIVVTAQSMPPAAATLLRTLIINVPKNCDIHDDLVIICVETKDSLRVPISSVLGADKTVKALQIAIFSERTWGESLNQVQLAANAELKRQGY